MKMFSFTFLIEDECAHGVQDDNVAHKIYRLLHFWAVYNSLTNYLSFGQLVLLVCIICKVKGVSTIINVHLVIEMTVWLKTK